MSEKSYEDGLQEGEVAALKETTANHRDRLDGQSNRLRGLEGTLWLAGGFVVAVQAIPTMQTLLQFLGRIYNQANGGVTLVFLAHS